MRKEEGGDAFVFQKKMDFHHPERVWAWSWWRVKEGPVSRDLMWASVSDSVFLLESPKPCGSVSCVLGGRLSRVVASAEARALELRRVRASLRVGPLSGLRCPPMAS